MQDIYNLKIVPAGRREKLPGKLIHVIVRADTHEDNNIIIKMKNYSNVTIDSYREVIRS